MKRMQKTFAVLLTAALLLTVFAVCASASGAAITSISVVTPPARTVYYVGADDDGTDILCDPSRMVLEVTDEFGNSWEESADSLVAWGQFEWGDPDALLTFKVHNYALGENPATVAYYDMFMDEYVTTEVTVTVQENPIQSVEILKMPTKTEYDLEKDVLTRENCTLEQLYAIDPEGIDEMLADLGLTYEEFIEWGMEEDLKNIIFAEQDALLLVDPTGMEIRVTYTDGTTEVLTDEDDYITHLGYPHPIYLEQKANTVTEGKNTMQITVLGNSAEFEVNVTKAGSANLGNTNAGGTQNTTEKDDIKNPDIPKTGMTAGITAAAVLMLSGTAGSALLLRRKEDK
ncbi:MAG: LPXTG cell wall anchor domain-containing protein [Candidatus Fimenecus sp.]